MPSVAGTETGLGQVKPRILESNPGLQGGPTPVAYPDEKNKGESAAE